MENSDVFHFFYYLCIQNTRGRVKFPTGGDSPRLPLGTESVEFRYRRSESGWKKKGSRALVRGKLCYRALMNFHRGFLLNEVAPRR